MEKNKEVNNLAMKTGLALVFVALVLVTFFVGSETAVVTDVKRENSVNVVDNEYAYLSIFADEPIIVSEGEVVETLLFVLANRLSVAPMHVSAVLPQSVTKEGYVISNLSYDEGPYFEEECHVSISIEGIKAGVYTEFFEIEVFWGLDYSSASALVHANAVEVTIVVQA